MRHLARRPRRAVVVLTALGAAALLTTAGIGGAARSQDDFPQNTTPPSVSGKAIVGEKLTASPGQWKGLTPITFQYQWLRCPGKSLNCKEITGAAGRTYTLVAADANNAVTVRVTARNSAGIGSAYAVPVGPVLASGGEDGLIVLPDGEKSISADSVPKGERLVVDRVAFDPNPVSTRDEPVTVRVKVKDTRGYVVRDARVFVRSTPILTSAIPRELTAKDGWVTLSFVPRYDFPLRTGYNVQFFVKAYRDGDPELAGISGTRLVQVATVG